MFNKKLLVNGIHTFGYLYLLYVIGYVEQERKKLAVKVKDTNKLRIKHNALIRTFEEALSLLSEEDQRRVIAFANVEMTFAKLTEDID